MDEIAMYLGYAVMGFGGIIIVASLLWACLEALWALLRDTRNLIDIEEALREWRRNHPDKARRMWRRNV